MTAKILSFFSGAGFLDLGFEDEGFTVVYVNELHSPFLDAYKYARRNLKIKSPQYGYHQGSITDFNKPEMEMKLSEIVTQSKEDGSLVGFIGGPPCPDFSIGGKNRGRHGDHGKLSHTYIELICQQKPDFFLFENVKGLWKTKRHREFYDELKGMVKAEGYKITERLINAIEYGAPQDRERIIMLGFRDSVAVKATGNPFACENQEITFFPWLRFAKYPNGEAFDYEWIAATPFTENQDYPCPTNVPEELTVEYWFKKNDVVNHENAKHCFTPKAGLARFISVDEGDDKKKSFKRLHRWRYSPTAAYGNNEVHLHPYKARRITVAEALAIQTLPKKFALPPDMTLSNMFKAVGNGVPYLAARMIARSIKSFMDDPYDKINSIKHSESDCTVAA